MNIFYVQIRVHHGESSVARNFFASSQRPEEKPLPDRDDHLRKPTRDKQDHDDEDKPHEERPPIRDIAQIVLEDDIDEGHPGWAPRRFPFPRRTS